MSHEIRRVLRAFAAQPWFIDPRKAEQIVAVLEARANDGPRAEPYRPVAAEPAPAPRSEGNVAVMRLWGAIMPRAALVADVSATGVSMHQFAQQFDTLASDPNVSAIVIEVDSPGGAVEMVPEVAAKIRAARRPDRPIVAVANAFAASAAYWIASAADELVVTPSGEVGSIGVYMMHENISAALEEEGIAVTFISEGPRKVEGNPFEPLSAEAQSALQTNVRYFYDLFVKDVAANRNVPAATVRADPESADEHFGGGRVYPARTAVKLGMADRVDTFENTLKRLQSGSRKPRKRADIERRRVALK